MSRQLRHLWEGPVHFVVRSFETTLTLPAEEPIDVAATVLRDQLEQFDRTCETIKKEATWKEAETPRSQRKT